MKKLTNYISEQIILEKHGMFDGCEEIAKTIEKKIRSTVKEKPEKITFKQDDFNCDTFFEELIIMCWPFIGSKGCNGEYKEAEDKMNDDKTKFKTVKMEIGYGLETEHLFSVLCHELTHAFDNYNRCRKDNIQKLSDIAGDYYYKAVDYAARFTVNAGLYSVSGAKRMLGEYFYFVNPSERNAYVATFCSAIKNMNVSLDLSKQDLVKTMYDSIKEIANYKTMKKISNFIYGLEKITKEEQENVTLVYNDIKGANKKFEQVKKELTDTWNKYIKKIDTTIGKAICDYIDDHIVSEKK